jgi:hypothetical protein
MKLNAQMNTTHPRRNIAVIAGCALALLTAGPASAALYCEIGILNLTANGGINPATGAAWKEGDTYRFAFLTSTSQFANSTDIETYNTLVQNLANTATLNLSAATWKVIGSTATVAARDNTSTNPTVDGTGESIFLVNGSTVVANNYADLWDGSIQNVININENGATQSAWPLTGTMSDGTPRNGSSSQRSPFGGGGVGIGQGNGGSTTEWVYRVNTGRHEAHPMYALSEPLSIIPEPAAVVLLGLGGIALLRRHR